MPSKYISKREIILSFLREIIIPNIKIKKDVDYQKLLDYIVLEKAASFKLAQECVDLFIRQGIIVKLGNILTIPDREVQDWLNNGKKLEIEIKKDLKVLEK